jgi:hypothetical protein
MVVVTMAHAIQLQLVALVVVVNQMQHLMLVQQELPVKVGPVVTALQQLVEGAAVPVQLVRIQALTQEAKVFQVMVVMGLAQALQAVLLHEAVVVVVRAIGVPVLVALAVAGKVLSVVQLILAVVVGEV